MKYLYHNERIRAKAETIREYGSKYLKLSVQAKRKWLFFWWWEMVKWVDVEIENYWGYIPGYPVHGRCLSLSYQFGGTREVWPPDIFNLKNRIQELIDEYLLEEAAAKRNQDYYKQQLTTL